MKMNKYVLILTCVFAPGLFAAEQHQALEQEHKHLHDDAHDEKHEKGHEEKHGEEHEHEKGHGEGHKEGHEEEHEHENEDHGEGHKEGHEEEHEHEEERHVDEGKDDGHGHGGDDHEDENVVKLSSKQLEEAGIQIEVLKEATYAPEIQAPGEVVLNAYSTSHVSPRLDVQVLERLAKLGDQVTKGQALVSLSSVQMSEAQGDLLVKALEWKRVRKLGKKVVSERRYLEANIAYQQARAKLRAYGLSLGQLNNFERKGAIQKADGRYVLYANQDGTVVSDDFVVGQMISAGEVLFTITDESVLWVEARVNPEVAKFVEIENKAKIKVSNTWLDGTVGQVHHQLDETTRTQAVRLFVNNTQDLLHPGQFVNTVIVTGATDKKVLMLPTEAIMRSPDGDWRVFVVNAEGELEPKEIELVEELSGSVVVEGIAAGSKVVTKGAFFVQSELAKSSFDVHNH